MARFRNFRFNPLDPDAPLLHTNHARPKTRREFIAQGLHAGMAMATAGGVMSLFAQPRVAMAQLSSDLDQLRAQCGINIAGAGKIPFICIELAGGANIAGSNVLVGQRGGQADFLTTAGYSKLGLPGDMVPGMTPAGELNSFVDRQLGLAFHSDSAFLRGILERVAPGTAASINGAIIPARSENDTANNPHIPLYGIAKAGADGSLLQLIGSRSTLSGARSMAPATMIDVTQRPTKVDRPSDVTGLVDVGDLIGVLNQDDSVAVMESIYRLSNQKLNQVNTQIDRDAVIKDLIRCGYLKSADLADRFGQPSALDPLSDPLIVGPGGIFSSDEMRDGEFSKTASIMKLVMNGYAGAGSITMNGFDYHTGDRATGEVRDLRAGRCMGACLEYAARLGQPLMLYVMSDGSVASNGRIDESSNGRGKGQWTGDNSSTAAGFFLVFSPNGRPTLLGGSQDEQAKHQQLGYMRADASVETLATPAANNVNLLVETVILNYLALHGEQNRFSQLFPNQGLGNSSLQDSLTAFNRIV